MNITTRCLDQHILAGKGSRTAFIEYTEDGKRREYSYLDLLDIVNSTAAYLAALGVKKGDRVVIYMHQGVMQVAAMLACARVGAIHSVVFAGFSDKALRDRIIDCGARIVIASTWTQRRGKKIDLIGTVREARESLEVTAVVYQRIEGEYELLENEKDLNKALAERVEFKAAEVGKTDPLFILYTSGSTGKPKGIVHVTGGYSEYAELTTREVFGLDESSIYWCTADPGWITGHTYVTYGPLIVGITSLIVEGAPDYPTAGRWFEIIEREKVSVFYTSPTALRLLRSQFPYPAEEYDFSSLKVIASVGEPLNPDVAKWFHEQVGSSNAHLIDTWWQTETGGHIIATPVGTPYKFGTTGKPLWGVEVDIVDNEMRSLSPHEKGQLVIKNRPPALLTACWNDEERYQKYFDAKTGFYLTGDMAVKDDEGYITILGRADDLINSAGHRIGTAEVESALVGHPKVAEAAIISIPDDIRGEAIKTFVRLNPGVTADLKLEDELKYQVRREVGAHAVPVAFAFVDSLPKTRSGKIMRRFLRAQELGLDVGDTSTLEG